MQQNIVNESKYTGFGTKKTFSSITKIDKDKLWVNPDCGLKTRGVPETEASLKNMVKAAEIIRAEL